MADFAKIEIKYIPELFPNSNFKNAKYKQDGQVAKLGTTPYRVFMTEKEWALTWDGVVIPRIRQAIYEDRWQVVLLVYEVADLVLSMSDHCTIIDVNGIQYDAFRVTTKSENLGHRKWAITVEFSVKNINSITYPLTHDNSLKLWKNNKNINRIFFTINNCPFIQYTDITYNTTLYRHEFIFVYDAVTRIIKVGDVFAFHSDIKELQGVVSLVKCFSISDTEISFYLIVGTNSINGEYKGDVTLDTLLEMPLEDNDTTNYFPNGTTITWDAGNSWYVFTLATDSGNVNLTTGDKFTLQVNHVDFNTAIGAICYEKTKNTRVFFIIFSGADPSPASPYVVNGTMYKEQLNQEITKRTLDLIIYSQLEPKLGKSEKFNQALELRQGGEEYGNVTVYKTSEILFFLKEADVYLDQYFAFADTIYLKTDTKEYHAAFRKDLVSEKGNNLTGQKEYELIIPYNLYNRNLQLPY